MSSPRFAAVIPAYNAERTLAAAIESALGQTREDLEIIVVNDGSSDGTSELAHEYERTDARIRVVDQANAGLAGARNTGIERSAAGYVGLLDSDDLWMPTFLEELGSRLDANAAVGFAYADGWVLDDLTGRIRRSSLMSRQNPPVPPPSDPGEFLEALVRRNFVPAEALIRRAALEQVGPYDVRLPAVEDYDLWLRMVSAGYRAAGSGSRLMIRRDLPTSMSKDAGVMLAATREVLTSICERDGPSPRVRGLACARIATIDRRLAMLEGRHPVRRTRERARLLLGARYRALMDRSLWYQQVPAEVSAAFPDLGRD